MLVSTLFNICVLIIQAIDCQAYLKPSVINTTSQSLATPKIQKAYSMPAPTDPTDYKSKTLIH